MEDLARTVSIIIAFPLLIAPIVFAIVRFLDKRWVARDEPYSPHLPETGYCAKL